MRLIDAQKFDEYITKVPEDVYDACSFVRGVETVLDAIRNAPTIVEGMDVFLDAIIPGNSDPRLTPADPRLDPRKKG